MEVNVNVKVSFEEASLNHLGKIFSACIGGPASPAPAIPAGVQVRPMAPVPPTPPKPEPVEDLPPDDAPAPIDNMTLNKAVKAAQAKVGADPIRALFKEYGIASSRDCPDGRRADLLSALQAL